MKFYCELFNLLLDLRKPKIVDEMHIMTYHRCHRCDDVRPHSLLRGQSADCLEIRQAEIKQRTEISL